MIAVDTNILVYAHRADSPLHSKAMAAMDRLAGGGVIWGVVWQCVHEFLAITTHPRIYSPPSTYDEARSEVLNWTEAPNFRFIAEGPAHWEALDEALRSSCVVGPKIHDARIAAVCKQHDVSELWSVDRDFSRFGGLRVVNPLAAAKLGRKLP